MIAKFWFLVLRVLIKSIDFNYKTLSCFQGEKACAEREMKKLHAQKITLERDISKQGQISERRRDSMVDRRSSIFDAKRPKGLSIAFDQVMQVNISCFTFKCPHLVPSGLHELVCCFTFVHMPH